MSSVEIHAAAIAATSLHPEVAVRLARALSAISAEFGQLMAEEVGRLRRLRASLPGRGCSIEAGSALREATAALRQDGLLLGYPLISEIAGSLLTILDACPADALPLDVVDAHIETMDVVLSDRKLKGDGAAALVADLAAAAADYVSAGTRAAC